MSQLKKKKAAIPEVLKSLFSKRVWDGSVVVSLKKILLVYNGLVFGVAR